MSKQTTLERYFDAIAARNFERINECLSDQLIFDTPVGMLTKSQMLELFGALFRAFPDIRFDHGPLTINIDVVTAEVRISGTHTGFLDLSFIGGPRIPATIKRVVLPAQDFHYTVRNERIERIVPTPVAGAGIVGMLEQVGGVTA